MTWNSAGSALMGVALVAVLWALAALLLGVRRRDGRLVASGQGAVVALTVVLTAAMGLLWVQFATNDFSNQVVAEHSSTDLPVYFKVAALWANNPGSLLLWVWMLSLFAAVAIFLKQKEGREVFPLALAIMMGVALFFVGVLNFVRTARPFVALPEPPAEGLGLNPLLQHPAMTIHPPMLYLGFVGFALPFAYALAALIQGTPGVSWIRATRRWTLLTWMLLSFGIILGGEWAYMVLGWGGYWAWDPVENASLLPWLTGTASLHSVMVQERKGMLKAWNVALVAVTFLLTIFGTYLSRSGILASVHAFVDPTLGQWFLTFLAFLVLLTAGVMVLRRRLLLDDRPFESLLSREAGFLFNNLLLVSFAFAVMWGTLFPLISQWLGGVKIAVTQEFFNAVNVPLGIALIFLMGVAPMLPWGKASGRQALQAFGGPLLAAGLFAVLAVILGIRRPLAVAAFTASLFVVFVTILEFWSGTAARMRMTGEGPGVALLRLTTRARRRFGGYLVHLAIVLMVLGITGSSAYKIERTVTVNPGDTISVGRYSLTYQGVQLARKGRISEVTAPLLVSSGGRLLPGPLRPGQRLYPGNPSPMAAVAIRGSLQEDLYVVLGGFGGGPDSKRVNGYLLVPASFSVVVNPLV
ncbi:MAG: heme lyase CcmF/NrfE family subunit, partial [Bacillota bacterium]